MEQAICPLSIVPVRKDPTDRAEQVTQWLFGETADVLERQEKWTRLRFHHDGYEGWVDSKQMTLAHDGVDMEPVRSAEQFMHIVTSKGALIIPFGAVLPSFSASHFKLGAEDLAFPGRSSAQLTGTPIQRLMVLKDQWMNTPYLWGGRSPFGVDCSGLTQMLFLLSGTTLPRDAYQQAEVGRPVDLIDLATTGDLAFFDNAEGRIVHVGIVLSDRRILHASGRVRIDLLDQEGIFDVEEKKYTHKLRLIKRVL
ncbi:MAG TPA: C40 family peptidase [Flavobacteriales bacterium]